MPFRFAVSEKPATTLPAVGQTQSIFSASSAGAGRRFGAQRRGGAGRGSARRRLGARDDRRRLRRGCRALCLAQRLLAVRLLHDLRLRLERVGTASGCADGRTRRRCGCPRAVPAPGGRPSVATTGGGVRSGVVATPGGRGRRLHRARRDAAPARRRSGSGSRCCSRQRVRGSRDRGRARSRTACRRASPCRSEAANRARAPGARPRRRRGRRRRRTRGAVLDRRRRARRAASQRQQQQCDGGATQRQRQDRGHRWQGRGHRQHRAAAGARTTRRQARPGSNGTNLTASSVCSRSPEGVTSMTVSRCTPSPSAPCCASGSTIRPPGLR